MIIKQIELIHIAIPLKKSFATSFGVIDHRPALIIKMTTDDGHIGYGESSPLYVPISEAETVSSSLEILKKILPKVLGIPIEKDFNIPGLYEEFHAPVSAIGIEGAYLDLVSQIEGTPLYKTFGGSHITVTAGESVGLQNSIDDTIKEVAQYITQGFDRIKIKIAPGHDVEVVKAVRNAFPNLCLGADANAAYTAPDVALLAKLADDNLAFVEQPFLADEYKANAELRRCGIAICLDETVRDMETCIRAVKEEACDMINIKPARIGSFREAKAIHDYCHERGIKLFGGGRLETGVGKTINAAFYALPGFTDASDLTPPQEYFEEDIIDPDFSLSKGLYSSLDGVGLGVRIKEDVLKKFTQEHFIF
jgi:O-succinylbenzoate synthase